MASYLSEVFCVNCQAGGLDLQAESTAVCRYCGTVNSVTGVICAQCECVNPAGAEVCEACRQTLSRNCPNCGRANWSGAERCGRCQTPLDAVAQLGARYGTVTAGRLNDQRSAAASIKVQEAADSQRRMTELNEIEQRRQEYLNDAIQQRDLQQRFWIAALIVLGFIVITGAILALVYFSSH